MTTTPSEGCKVQSVMNVPERFFVRRRNLFETPEDEIAAVQKGNKALAWFPMTRDQVEVYSDYEEVVAAAMAAGLSVLARPRRRRSDLSANVTEVDVFVLRDGEGWRVDAFLACREVLGAYQWSDSSEYLYSKYLGYSEEDCAKWVSECRYNRLGWIGQTVYCPLEEGKVDLLEQQAFRCFPSSFDVEGVIVISHPDGWSLRRDLHQVLPPGVSLCRFAFDNIVFLRLFSEMQGEGPVRSVRLDIPVRQLNEALVSSIELWTENGWKTGNVRRAQSGA